MTKAQKTNDVINEIKKEAKFAMHKFKKFNSPHEGIAVLREEYLELEQEIFKNQKIYDKVNMRKEAVQVATMAIRIIVDCID